MKICKKNKREKNKFIIPTRYINIHEENHYLKYLKNYKCHFKHKKDDEENKEKGD